MGHIETLKHRGVTASFSNLNQRFFSFKILVTYCATPLDINIVKKKQLKHIYVLFEGVFRCQFSKEYECMYTYINNRSRL